MCPCTSPASQGDLNATWCSEHACRTSVAQGAGTEQKDLAAWRLAPRDRHMGLEWASLSCPQKEEQKNETGEQGQSGKEQRAPPCPAQSTYQGATTHLFNMMDPMKRSPSQVSPLWGVRMHFWNIINAQMHCRTSGGVVLLFPWQHLPQVGLTGPHFRVLARLGKSHRNYISFFLSWQAK